MQGVTWGGVQVVTVLLNSGVQCNGTPRVHEAQGMMCGWAHPEYCVYDIDYCMYDIEYCMYGVWLGS